MNQANKWLVGMVGAVLIASTTLWEGNKLTPYKDVTGTWTACQGVTENINPNKIYTQPECDALLSKHLAEHGKDALSCINVPISKNEYDAYTMFTYNVGATNFCSSGALKELNKGNHEEACKRLYRAPDGSPAWSYSKGKFFQGLQNRRKYESNLCLGTIQHPQG